MEYVLCIMRGGILFAVGLLTGAFTVMCFPMIMSGGDGSGWIIWMGGWWGNGGWAS